MRLWRRFTYLILFSACAGARWIGVRIGTRAGNVTAPDEERKEERRQRNSHGGGKVSDKEPRFIAHTKN